MRALPLIPLLLGGWLILPAHAADSSPEAGDWLKKLALAEQQQSYQGTFVYERNGSFSTHDIWHRVQGGKVSERLFQLDGSVQEVVRVDGHTQCASGALVSSVANTTQTSARVLDPLKLMSWYDLTVAGKSRVADREAVIVSLTPRDQHRYGFELHLDSKTSLPLKSLMLDDKGRLLERLQYTRLDTSTTPTDDELKPSERCKPLTQQAAQVAQPVTGWRSDWLPPGFELVDSSVRKDPQGKNSVNSLMYDDGLARFSVFVEALGGGSAADIRTQLGPTVAVSRRLTTPRGEVMVTVVGEIPIGTAERIALSMRSQETQAQK